METIRAKCQEKLKTNEKKMNVQGNKFEKEWKKWDIQSMIKWFKYVLMLKKFNDKEQDMMMNDNGQVDNDNQDNFDTPGASVAHDIEINWQIILSNLSRKEWNGQYLSICNQSELKKLGFDNENDRIYLMKKIQSLVNN